jgi:hypothetical protein
MLRRWIIRGIAIAVLTLCVAAWVGSYFRWVAVCYGRDTHSWWLRQACGKLFFNDQYRPPGYPNEWYMQYGRCDAYNRDQTRGIYEKSAYHLMGFAWEPPASRELSQWIMIPLWFPTTLSAGLLWPVWRKTRPKYKGKGFPVEPGGAAKPTKL